VLKGKEIDTFTEAKKVEPGEMKLFNIPNGIVAVGSVPMTDWYYTATIKYGMADYDTAMTVLFILVLLLILGVLVIFNIFIERFVKSLRKSSDALAMVSKAREQELIADNDILDRMNRMKNEFFQNVSHDFKTPLTVISTSVLNAADIIDFKIDKKEIRESLDNAQREVMRMARMVDGLMKYSSLYDYRRDMKSLDLAQLLNDGAATYRALLERNGNTLLLEIPDTLSHVYGNSDVLLHVLSNLLSNANRHTRDGKISIKATADEDTVTVTVTDTGTGIKPDMLPKIFERGVSDGGMGLGLSICKTAIEAHNTTKAQK
jgi:signal transduction histidine kinase